MFHYGILLYPSANRVYAAASADLMRAELAVFNRVLGGAVEDVGERRLGGVGYVTFSTARRLSEEDITLLSNLSSLYALFELTEDMLRPVEVSPLTKFGSDLMTIQKYSGKTNELFTKLLLNVTLLSTSDPTAFLTRPLHVLDPLCGRGTTLNQAMDYGLDATGVDLDKRDFDAYAQFIKTWLRTKRIKHTADTGQLRRDKVLLGRRLELAFGLSKEEYKAGEARHITFYNCDTVTGAGLLKSGSVDAIVTDAPYGVQHGSHRTGALSRSPRELLAEAVPAWTRTLRSGGALGISWNTHVVKREEIAEIVSGAGLEVAELDGFAHRVDQAILRDLLVARKP